MFSLLFHLHHEQSDLLKFQALKVINIKMPMFWDVAACKLVLAASIIRTIRSDNGGTDGRIILKLTLKKQNGRV